MPLAKGCSRTVISKNIRKLQAESPKRSRKQTIAIALSEARRTGKGRACRPPPRPLIPSPAHRAAGSVKRMRPTPAAVGKRYVEAELVSDHFTDWMYQQLEATGPDLRDEATPENARRIARNMLEELRYETSRQVSDRDVERLLMANNARSDREAVREWGHGMRTAYEKARPWLADEVLYQLKEKHKRRSGMWCPARRK